MLYLHNDGVTQALCFSVAGVFVRRLADQPVRGKTRDGAGPSAHLDPHITPAHSARQVPPLKNTTKKIHSRGIHARDKLTFVPNYRAFEC